MVRSIFGWDLPPGCTHRMIDEAMGVDQPCEVCGVFVDDCICPECKVCGEYGDPACYSKHGMEKSDEQIKSFKEYEAAMDYDARVDDHKCEQYMEDKKHGRNRVP